MNKKKPEDELPPPANSAANPAPPLSAEEVTPTSPKEELSCTSENQPPEHQKVSEAQEIERLKKDLLYLKAEFENYKKQAIKERSELIKYGGETLVLGLLDVLDNFDRALSLEVQADTMESFKEGIQMTESGLRDVIKRFGVEEIECHHKPFDPSLHEAMGSEESSEIPPGHIIQVFKKPYKFHKKIIRPGQVIVAKKREKAD